MSPVCVKACHTPRPHRPGEGTGQLQTAQRTKRVLYASSRMTGDTSKQANQMASQSALTVKVTPSGLVRRGAGSGGRPLRTLVAQGCGPLRAGAHLLHSFLPPIPQTHLSPPLCSCDLGYVTGPHVFSWVQRAELAPEPRGLKTYCDVTDGKCFGLLEGYHYPKDSKHSTS